MPSYRLPHLAFTNFPILDEKGCHQGNCEVAEEAAVLENLPCGLPWKLTHDGTLDAENSKLGPEEFKQDALRFAICFSRDHRALHCHNHDHNCSFTCIKYVKAKAKKTAEAGLQTATNIVCRFFFFITLTFNLLIDGVEQIRRVRRRGKLRILTPFVASTNQHNELGRVQVERHTPFRGPTSDVGQCASRNNFDLQFMPRAPVLDDNTVSTETQDSAGKPAAEQSKEKVLSYDRAEAFYGFRRHLQQNPDLRRAAYSMLAMWQAAHNTDFYITK